MNPSIISLAENYFASLSQALDVVVREKKYLAFTQAPPLAQSVIFYRNIIDNDLAHFIAVEDEKVLGWCDVQPVHGQARSHVGVLGIGLIPEARHQGLGAQLLRATLDKARAKGITRVELSVRTSN